jgi:L-fuculose-phosphate aldolase
MRLRREIVNLAREARTRGLVTSTVGNLSARRGSGMLITPTRRDYADLTPRQLVALGLDGTLRGRGQPSREWRLHAAIYRARPDVRAIVHTHSPYATARSFERVPLIVHTEERDYIGLDRIEVAPWRPAGSEELARLVTRALDGRPAVLLARHGVLAVGSTPRDALEMCCAVEHQALIERDVRRLPRFLNLMREARVER